MTSLNRVTIASRVFCIAAILGLGLLSGDREVIVSLMVLATVATSAVYVTLATPLATAAVVTVEAGITGLVIGLALPGGVVFLPYLIVLTLIAGITRGVVAVSAVILAQFCAILIAMEALSATPDRGATYQALAPWLLTSVGAGLLGSWLGRLAKFPERREGTAPYESARRLLSQLRTVARRLPSGLDPASIATQVASIVQDALPDSRVAIFVRREGGLLSPLAYSDPTARAELNADHALASECWTEMEPKVSASDPSGGDTLVALPLRAGAQMIGVVLAQVPTAQVRGALDPLMGELDEYSIRLDTALAFDEIRSIATMEERRRLAREIHDGVAQEIASLGYVVDELLADARDQGQSSQLKTLREELTRVVSELRLSIFDLRSEVLSNTSLGAALTEYVRQVGARSSMTVHLTLNEAPTRLRAETEAELLRIAQEAVTNARKHSGAANLWVDCQVRPPYAQLEIRDDGVGMGEGRSDSYGVRIMKERARRLDARLDISKVEVSKSLTGTLVRVRLGSEPTPKNYDESGIDDSTEAHHHRSC